MSWSLWPEAAYNNGYVRPRYGQKRVSSNAQRRPSSVSGEIPWQIRVLFPMMLN